MAKSKKDKTESITVTVYPPQTIKVDKKDKRFCGEDCPLSCGGGAGYHFGSNTCRSYGLCSLTDNNNNRALCYAFEENDYRRLRTLICYESEK